MTSSTNEQTKHWVVLGGPAWGHTHSIIQLCSNLLTRSCHLEITLFVHHSQEESCKAEKKRCAEQLGSRSALDKLQLSFLRADGNFKPSAEAFSLPVFALFEECQYAFEEAWKQLTKPSSELTTPSVVLGDIFLRTPYELLRSTIPSLKVYVWFSSSLTSFWQHFAPMSLGGEGDFSDYVKTNMKNSEVNTGEKEYGEFFSLLYSNRSHDVVKIPGLPAVHSYERVPSHLPAPNTLYQLLGIAIEQVLKSADGTIVASSEWHEPEMYSACRSWYEGQVGKKLFATGLPLLVRQNTAPNGSPKGLPVKEVDMTVSLVLGFLDRQLLIRGEKSVIYISFGTNFFPFNHPDQVPTLLDVLLSSKRPFVLSRAAQLFQDCDKDLQRRIWEAEADGACFVSKWIPQIAVLEHPATSTFLTHCGWNSTCEAIQAGVPMICWPFLADQPGIALRHSLVLDTSWELLEVRGPSVVSEAPLRPLKKKPTGTITALREEIEAVLEESEVGNSVGDQKRENMQRLSLALHSSLEMEGETCKNLDRFLAGEGCLLDW